MLKYAGWDYSIQHVHRHGLEKNVKETIAVLFGGMSSEHDVSCVSACNVIDNINKEDYDILLIGITKTAAWLYVSSADEIKAANGRKVK